MIWCYILSSLVGYVTLTIGLGIFVVSMEGKEELDYFDLDEGEI